MTGRVRTVAVVSGHVQGVGYRYFVRGLAGEAGLTGSARNLPDGRVEVVLEGPADAVRSVVDALDGPRAPGRVTRVDVRDDRVQDDAVQDDAVQDDGVQDDGVQDDGVQDGPGFTVL